MNVKLTPETIFKRVEPGENNLKKAADMKMTDMALGDRVLVSFKPGTTEALRILVMSATDITKRNEADSLDWTKRGDLRSGRGQGREHDHAEEARIDGRNRHDGDRRR